MSGQPCKQPRGGAKQRRLRIALLCIGAVLVLTAAALLTVTLLTPHHKTRATQAAQATLEDLKTLFPDDSRLSAAARALTALGTRGDLCFTATGTLTAAPHLLFGDAAQQWPLTLTGDRDTDARCCAGTLLLGRHAEDALAFSFDAEALLLGMQGLDVYRLTQAELEESLGLTLPEAFGFAGPERRDTEFPAVETLLRTLLDSGSGALGPQGVSIETDGGTLRCDGYDLRWQPEAVRSVLTRLGQSELADAPLLPDGSGTTGEDTVPRLLAAVRDGALNAEGAAAALLSRLLLSVEPTARVWLDDARIRGVELTRRRDGAPIRVLLCGAENVFAHVTVCDGNDTVLDWRYDPDGTLSLRVGQAQDELLFFDEQSGAFRLRLGETADRQQSGSIGAADGTLTLTLGEGSLLPTVSTVRVPLPQVEFLGFRTGLAPLELTLRVETVTLGPERQTPRMLSGTAKPLLQLSLLDTVQVCYRLLQVFQRAGE